MSILPKVFNASKKCFFQLLSFEASVLSTYLIFHFKIVYLCRFIFSKILNISVLLAFFFKKWTFALVGPLYCIFAFRLIDFHPYLYGFLPSPLFVFILLFSYLSCLAHLFSALFSFCISTRSCKFGLRYASVRAHCSGGRAEAGWVVLSPAAGLKAAKQPLQAWRASEASVGDIRSWWGILGPMCCTVLFWEANKGQQLNLLIGAVT